MLLCDEKITVVKRCNDRQKSEITLKEALAYIEKSNDLKSKVEAIRSIPKEEEEKRKKEKVNKLSGFVFSGVFDKDVKKDSFISSSGLFCIDIDHIGNVHASKLIISKIPYVVSCFISPSGDGLKAIIRVNKEKIKCDADLKKLFPSIRELFLESGFTLDEARKDISGLCFASYDSELYINYDANVFDPVIVEEQRQATNEYNTGNNYTSSDSKYCIDTVVKNIISMGTNGNRHATRLKMGRLAGGFIAAGRVDEGEIRAALQRASDFISDKGVTSKEEQKTLEDGIEQGKKEPVSSSYKEMEFSYKYDNSFKSDNETTSEPWLSALHLANNAKSPEYLIDNIIESKSHGIIAGSSQSFKSFCVLKMANSIASGHDFFGHEVFKTGKVLYICGEGMGALERRVKALNMVEGLSEHMLVKAKPLSIDNMQDMDWLRDQILEIKPVLAIFDTFSSLATNTKENVNEDVAKCLKYVSGCCIGTDTATIIVHHYGKDAEKGSRGASAFSANVDFELSMVRTGQESDRTATLSCKKSKDGEYFNPIDIKAHVVELGLIQQNGKQSTSLVLMEAGRNLTGNNEQAFKAIVSLLARVGSLNHDLIKAELNDVFSDHGKNRYMSTKRSIEFLIKRGFIERKGDEFYISTNSDVS